MRPLVKQLIREIFLVLLLPPALLCGFGRLKGAYTCIAQLLGLVPGLPGVYVRTAWYRWTLLKCSPRSATYFGTYFAHPRDTEIADDVEIGAYCIIGCVAVGERTRMGSQVQIISGANQHTRDEQGRLQGEGRYTQVRIGADCWIGAGAIIMADVGDRCTIGAGAVVGTPIATGKVAAGNPARVVMTAPASIAK